MWCSTATAIGLHGTSITTVGALNTAWGTRPWVGSAVGRLGSARNGNMRSVVKLQTLTIANKRWLVLYAVDRESAAAAHRKVLRTDVLPKTDKLTADKAKLSKAVNGEYTVRVATVQ